MIDHAKSALDDSELLVQARDGDQAAFAEIATRHRTRIWAVCLNIVGNQADAEDALQDTLIAAWQNLHKFRGEAKLTTWLHRIAANSALAVVRRRKPNTDIVDFNDPERPVLLDDDPPLAFDDHLAIQDQLRIALAEIPDAFREALVLREFADMTYEQIAEHQQVPVQTVRSRLNRARKQLAERIQAYDYIDTGQ
ncbi:sigma-70 family RNA polymerase sigma factor [uncultured Williamsia sp.]|uniref:RNA polymerase sigma factor n=1 Tax=uncultured Williamsia sp. TaxID=259311 RepID=UPI002627CA31|nr:sigma-70 family RNA polymerase sigma factor [uncultured Williamsia sp.]